MFTIKDIELAHSKVKSGADFPKYIQELKILGIQSFETWVKDSHTTYHGLNDFVLQSKPQYQSLIISQQLNKDEFILLLKKHQKGETDYFTFCNDCAKTGILKWVVDLNNYTCT